MVAADLPALATVEEGGVRYEYDALLDRERLFTADAPSLAANDVSQARPADVVRLRAKLLRRLGLRSLDPLRDAHREAADALRRLGYL